MTRAIQYQHFGGPEVLEIADVIDAVPGPHQVRVSTRAAGLNPVDWKVFSGMIGKDASHLPQGVGHDFSGVVSAIGSEDGGRRGMARAHGSSSVVASDGLDHAA